VKAPIDSPAIRAAAQAGIAHRVVTFGRVGSLAEAALSRGIDVSQIVKTLVVRRGEDDHVLVLVPGDRVIDWRALRAHLGVSRLSLADADEARRVTGYERGTITPFGAPEALPVIADVRVDTPGEVSVGGGAHGVAIHLAGRLLVEVVGAEVADVTADAAPRGG
jgi:Cys-tRNA(Pro) deacylase